MKRLRKLGVLLAFVGLLLTWGCGGGGGGSPTDSPTNSTPVANAGIDQNITTGNLVTLDGSVSNDADGDLLSYSWTITVVPAGSSATLSNASAARPTFIADVDGNYVFSLVVNDGLDNSTAVSVSISAAAATANSTPVANAGIDQNITTGSTVTLDGSTSSDADGDSLSYSWTITSVPAGSSASLSNASVARPTFTADNDGNYVFSLIVNDGLDNSSADTVTVTAATPNSTPVANAGIDQNITTGSTVTLDGSTSSDADGDPLSYSWSITSVPAGSSATLSDASAARPTFTADNDGNYVFRLVVNDGSLNSSADTLTITAATPNSTPVANAGIDQNIATGSMITLDGSTSSDADGDSLSYSWTITSVPAGSSASLSNASVARPTFTADNDGNYVFSLIVNDGLDNSSADTVTVTAATPNSTPVANAGIDQNITTGSTVTLDGSTSSDADGDPLSYSWSITSVPAGSSATLSDASAARPTFTADNDGNYVFRLVVNDGSLNSSADTLTITAATPNSVPVANAGADQNITTGSTVTLDGSTSSDADGDPLSYSWTISSVPAGSSASLSDTTAAKPTFTTDVDGNYVFSLVVNDGSLNSSADTVTITAATANSAPVANAGIDQNITTGNLVTLDGSTSSDADGDPLSYSWSITSVPAGSSASLSAANVAQPTFTADIDGNYVFSLIVNDGSLNSAADSVTITAEAVVISTMLALPDTGQTTCYDTAGTVIACARTGQDGEYSINPMAYIDNGNGTVTDNVTGLIWQQSDDDNKRTWAAAGSYCTNLTLAGSSNWRLPTTNELMSLIDYSVPYPGPTIDSLFSGTSASASGYWSSSSHAGYPDSAWDVTFYYGYVGYSNKTYYGYVRCVR
jgi:hypothetical protein